MHYVLNWSQAYIDEIGHDFLALIKMGSAAIQIAWGNGVTS